MGEKLFAAAAIGCAKAPGGGEIFLDAAGVVTKLSEYFPSIVENFIIWIGTVGAICIGVIVLTVFFTILGVVKDWLRPGRYIKFQGFIKEADSVDVHLTSGKVMKDLRFLGFTDPASIKGNVPYQLQSMMLFETEDRRRVMMRGDLVKIIEMRQPYAES